MIMRDHITAKERLRNPWKLNLDRLAEDAAAAIGLLTLFYFLLIAVTN